MVKRLVLATVIVLLAAASAAPAALAYCPGGGGGGGGCGGGGGGGTGGGPLTSAEIEWLIFMRQEEKLARDTYLTMYGRWSSAIFSRIASCEQRHTDAVEALLDKYGVPDPVVDESKLGDFTDPGLAVLYAQLLASGSASLSAAYQVGVDVEVKDIADLKTAIGLSAHSDILNVYNNLLAGSECHLSAFTSRL